MPVKVLPKGPPNISELDRICQRAIQSHWATGAACILAAPRGRELSQVVHVGTLGRTHRFQAAGSEAINKDTLFDVGSLTESLGTATVALMLMGQGRVALTTRLGQCLPEAARGPLAERTLGALLSHTAGLPEGNAALLAALASAPAPERPRRAAAGQAPARITTKPTLDAQGMAVGAGPLSPEALAALKATLCKVAPVRPEGEAAGHTPLGPLLVGWALEHIMGKPLDVLLQQWVVQPLLPKNAVVFCRNGPLGPLVHPPPAATTIDCPWRHRQITAEAQDKLAWLLGGVAGHSGLFASADGAMRLVLGLLFSLNGVVRYAQGGTLQRFWSQPGRKVVSPYTPGWMVPCRQNGMVPGRWSSRAVGQVDPSGSAIFIDPAHGLLGVLLMNGNSGQSEAAQEGLAQVRQRVFDTMASYGQNLTASSSAASRRSHS